MTAAVKRVLVTGASEGGLGWALAKAFRDKGCLVVAAVRNRSKVQTAASYGIEVVEMDVTDTASIQDAARLLSEQDNGGLDILVNNAGVLYNMPLLDVDIEDANACFDVNLFGALATMQAFFPLLKQSQGNIINIGSITGRVPAVFSGIYGCSKSALEMISWLMSMELKPYHVSVTHVVAGYIDTKLSTNAQRTELSPQSAYYEQREKLRPLLQVATPAGVNSIAPAEDVALSIVNNALRSRPRAWLWTGAGALRTRLISAFLPRSLYGFVARLVGASVEI